MHAYPRMARPLASPAPSSVCICQVVSTDQWYFYRSQGVDRTLYEASARGNIHLCECCKHRPSLCFLARRCLSPTLCRAMAHFLLMHAKSQ